jgi:hypothetical protein
MVLLRLPHHETRDTQQREMDAIEYREHGAVRGAELV